MLLTVDPDGTERVLVDPVAVDPSGTTTLDAWQPSQGGRPARLPALRGRHRGVGAARHGRRHRRRRSTGPIDRARYSPVAWLPGGEAYYYVRRRRARAGAGGRGAVPPPGLAAPASAPTRTTTSLVFGDGPGRRPTTTASRCRWTAAGWSIGASAGTAPRNDLWLADLSDGRARVARRCASCRRTSTRRPSLHVGRDGRVYVFTDRDAPRGRLVRDDARTTRRTSTGATWCPRTPRRCSRASRSSTAPELAATPRAARAVRWTRHAVSELTVHDLRTGERHRRGAAARARLGRRHGRAARGRPRGVVRLHRPRHAGVGLPLRRDAPARPSLWADRAGHRRGARGARPAGRVHRRPTAPPCGCSSSRPGRRSRDRPRPTILYGYGGFGIPLTPGYSAGAAGLGRGRRRLRGRPPARRRREEGEEWHRAGMRGQKQNVFDDFHAAAERLVADGWTTPATSWRSPAAPTAGCWSARR